MFGGFLAHTDVGHEMPGPETAQFIHCVMPGLQRFQKAI
jgi:hypothetical protein